MIIIFLLTCSTELWDLEEETYSDKSKSKNKSNILIQVLGKVAASKASSSFRELLEENVFRLTANNIDEKLCTAHDKQSMEIGGEIVRIQ